jgi:hypothetical protein
MATRTLTAHIQQGGGAPVRRSRRNDTNADVELAGWTLADVAEHVFTFPSFVLAPATRSASGPAPAPTMRPICTGVDVPRCGTTRETLRPCGAQTRPSQHVLLRRPLGVGPRRHSDSTLWRDFEGPLDRLAVGSSTVGPPPETFPKVVCGAHERLGVAGRCVEPTGEACSTEWS